ncbi:MAG TPA: peptide chain release factor N(5)-glutamine methyltransferase [Candidatus Scybalousia intestinigallinarum]|nr:peptide chain release factor N(5)-glutamine methyltransferase [Candidatus Scybalousia intestinigallinarum]
MATIEELIVEGKKKVHSTHAKMLLADLLDKNPLELLLHLDEEVTPEIEQHYYEQIQKLANQQPLQYVIGNVNFYGNTFIVNPSVLIPRFETEELVENTLNFIEYYFPQKDLKIIDLGTGSGCIGITLKKKLPTAQVTLVDISKEALTVAKENANLLDVEVTCVESDFWENITDRYHIVISNPPYLKTQEEVEKIVVQNEPHLALFAGEEGLDGYQKILSDIKDHLEDQYLVAFEIGFEQGDILKSMFQTIFTDALITVKKDLQGRDRMIFALKKKA